MVIFSEGSLARTKKFSPMVPCSVFRNPEAFRDLKMVAPSSALLYRSDATQGGFSIVTKYFALLGQRQCGRFEYSAGFPYIRGGNSSHLNVP